MTEPTDLERRVDALAISFGSAVRERRVAAGLTQDQLALATGVSRGFLIDMEAGKASSQLGRSLLIAEALGVQLADLIRQAPIRGHSNDDLPPPPPAAPPA